MKTKWITGLVAGALGLGLAGAASAQSYLDQETIRITRAPDWNVAAADGICRLRVWVDDRARVQLRGDQLVVRTQSGNRSFDEGSSCNQPLPLGRIDDFRVVTEHGRGAVIDVDRPGPRNDFTTALTIDDPQNGGSEYEVVVAWRNPERVVVAPVVTAPVVTAQVYPAFDETRACQDRVRGDFIARNASDAYLEFIGVPARDAMGPRRDRIRGEAVARNRIESRTVTYECVVNERSDRVLSATYEVLPRPRYSSLY